MTHLKLRILAILIAAIGLLVAFTQMASSQSASGYFRAPMTLHCNHTGKVMASIQKKYKEKLNGWGTDHRGLFLLQLWVSDDGSFTVTSTRKDKKTCVLAVGKDWQVETPQVGDPT